MKNAFIISIVTIFILSACDNQQAKEPQAPYDAKLDFQCFQHFYGSGDTPQDIDKAFPICLEAAKTGAQGSQYAVGMSYLLGAGQEVNKDKAIYWLTKSADRGHTGAIQQLQKMSIE